MPERKPIPPLPLSAYLGLFGANALEKRLDNPETPIAAVVNDSRQVTPGALFVAVKGAALDGAKFIPAAIAAGATAIVHQCPEIEIPAGVAAVRVRDAYAAYALAVAASFGNPTRRLKIVGVTGTKGKTTSTYLLREALRKNGLRVAMITTVEYAVAGRDEPADRTTPEAGKLQALFADALAAGEDHVVMEVSSHALDQSRLGEVVLAAGVFTNLTGDHLDYHGDMEHYFAAKKRLFSDLSGPATAKVIHGDDPYGRRLLAEFPDAVSFGETPDSGVQILSRKGSPDGMELVLRRGNENFTIRSGLAGAFNAENLAGAFAAAVGIGLPPDRVAAAISGPVRVPGRLERVPSPPGTATFLVDYAHTDDALRRALSALREDHPARIVCLFGCGGDRDKTKRPRMAAVAAALADLTIVTSDNPRTEVPERIIDDILVGLPPKTNHLVIPDRRAAIDAAVRASRPGDIVLIAGKGHEDYQEVNGVKSPFDDRVEVRRAIAARYGIK